MLHHSSEGPLEFVSGTQTESSDHFVSWSKTLLEPVGLSLEDCVGLWRKDRLSLISSIANLTSVSSILPWDHECRSRANMIYDRNYLLKSCSGCRLLGRVFPFTSEMNSLFDLNSSNRVSIKSLNLDYEGTPEYIDVSAETSYIRARNSLMLNDRRVYLTESSNLHRFVSESLIESINPSLSTSILWMYRCSESVIVIEKDSCLLTDTVMSKLSCDSVLRSLIDHGKVWKKLRVCNGYLDYSHLLYDLGENRVRFKVSEDSSLDHPRSGSRLASRPYIDSLIVGYKPIKITKTSIEEKRIDCYVSDESIVKYQRDIGCPIAGVSYDIYRILNSLWNLPSFRSKLKEENLLGMWNDLWLNQENLPNDSPYLIGKTLRMDVLDALQESL